MFTNEKHDVIYGYLKREFNWYSDRIIYEMKNMLGEDMIDFYYEAALEDNNRKERKCF